MRHVTVDEWSTGNGPLHKRDARAKLISLVALLVAISLASGVPGLAALSAVLLCGFAFSRAPLKGFVLRLAAILPFPGTFALILALTGEPDRALLLFTRSLLSVTAILVTVATTPMSGLLNALTWFRAPLMLVEIVQFVYRYLFVLGEEAWHIRTAAAVRGGRTSLLAAASSVGVLFGRAYGRAEGIHRAILSRSFSGIMSAPVRQPFTYSDFWFVAGLLISAALCVASDRLL